MSADRWMYKGDVVQIYKGILFRKKNEVMPFKSI